MLRWLSPGILLTAALAQAPSIDGLTSLQWRVRNDTARAIAQQPTLPVEALLEVLRADWNGHAPMYGRYGGRGGTRRPTDPREQVLFTARQELTGYPVAYATDDDAGDDAPRTLVQELGVPWHPHHLALRLLLSRPSDGPVADLAPTSVDMARAWLHLNAPDDDALATALGDELVAADVVMAAYLNGDDSRARLNAIDLADKPHARRAALRIHDAAFRTFEQDLPLIVTQALFDHLPHERRHAGGLLLAEPGLAGAALAPHCASEDRTVRDRALGICCLLGHHAAPAVEHLLAAPTMRVTGKYRALVTLANVPIPPTLRPRAATMAYELLLENRMRTVKTLALDALGNCATGVSVEMRERLVGMFDEPVDGGLKARVLACLFQLDESHRIDLETKAYVVTTVNATTDTWRALADEGAAAAPQIVTLFDERPDGVDVQDVVDHFAMRAPDVVKGWLAYEQRRHYALHALRSAGVDVGADVLVDAVAAGGWSARAALSWLAERENAAALAQRVIPHIVATSDRYVWTEGLDYLRRLDLPPEQKVEQLEPLLRRGLAWEAFAPGSPAIVADTCRRLAAEADDGERRDKLTAQLCRLGLEERDVALVRGVLRGPERGRTLGMLDEAPHLPAALRADLIAICDEEPRGSVWLDDYEARAALLAHR